MVRVSDLLYLLRKGLDRVRWDEPGRFDVVSLQQVEQAIDSDCRAENTTRDIC
jgi:hypothetical protein